MIEVYGDYETRNWMYEELRTAQNQVDTLKKRVKELENPPPPPSPQQVAHRLELAVSEAQVEVHEAVQYTRNSYTLIACGVISAGVAWTPLVPWLGLTAVLTLVGVMAVVGGVMRLTNEDKNLVGIGVKRKSLRLAQHKLSAFYLEQ